MANTIDPEIIKRLMRNYEYGANHFGKESSYTPSTESASIGYGMDLYNRYSPKVQKEIKNNRQYWADALESRYGSRKIPVTNSKGEVVYTVDLDKFLNTKDYNDVNSRYVNGLMYKLFPNQIAENVHKIDPKTGLVLKDKEGNNIKVDSPDDQLAINSGDNIYYNMLISQPAQNISRRIPKEWEDLKILGLGRYENDNKRGWGRYEGKNNDVYYDFYEKNDNGFANPTVTLVYDKNKGTWQQYSYDKDGNENVRDIIDINDYRGKDLQSIKDTEEGNRLMDERYKIFDSSNRNNHISADNNQPVFMRGNSKGVTFNKKLSDGIWSGTEKREKSLGGRTTRYYAVGGTTGEQIPIGEVEQPNDYNMIGEGGTHEENPMGGVPYGVNQDGTQNMVEEGEVSVGNNVFSDRTQMSPELCQQLGLPEGTSPAKAMQQIEQLYEQGQIGDEEFQEIQQIIFQDQEAQKQGAEGNIEQMQSEMPSEGIQPDMMQGASMQPEMMQQGAPPMQPQMQQGAPEGIQPEMVQGYGFGGRRWGCR